MMPTPMRPRYKFAKVTKAKIVRDKARSHLERVDSFVCTYGACEQPAGWGCWDCNMGRCNLHHGLRDAVCPHAVSATDEAEENAYRNEEENERP